MDYPVLGLQDTTLEYLEPRLERLDSLLTFPIPVPPDRPRLVSQVPVARVVGDLLAVSGEERNLTVVCEVRGGQPAPAVTWWRDNTLIDTSFER